jgi:hypothetical protein
MVAKKTSGLFCSLFTSWAFLCPFSDSCLIRLFLAEIKAISDDEKKPLAKMRKRIISISIQTVPIQGFFLYLDKKCGEVIFENKLLTALIIPFQIPFAIF